MRDVAFDDIAALRDFVSEDFGPWGEPCEISQEMIDRFADLTGDRQWIHVDAERAKHGPFGGTVAHGFLLLSLMPAVRPIAPYRLTGWGAAANYGIRALRFLQPVPSGSRIHARARLAEVAQHRRGTLLTQEVVIQDVDSDRPSAQFELQLLYMP